MPAGSRRLDSRADHVQTLPQVGSLRDASSLLESGLERVTGGRRVQPLRIGVIGLGAVAQAVHLPLLAKHPALFTTTAVCELSPATRAAVAERAGVPEERRFADASELLSFDGLDAVAILTSGSHGGLAAQAAAAGLAVFCEKPLAHTLAEADALAAHDPRLMLGYMKLYDPAVERARAVLEERPPARSVEVTVLHPPAGPQLAHSGLLPPAADVDSAALGHVRAADAGARERALGKAPAELERFYEEIMLGSVVHDLAVVRYLLGGPLRIDFADAWPDGSAAASIALAGNLSDGTRVSIRWHYLESYPAYHEEVRVHDETGTVELRFPSPYLLYAPTVLRVRDGAGGGEREVEYRSTIEAFERQWLAFADYAAGGPAPRAGVAEGREDIVVCQGAAAALAARRGLVLGGEAGAASRAWRDTAVGASREPKTTGPKEEAQ